MDPYRPPTAPPWTPDEKSGVGQPPTYEESTAGNPPPSGFYPHYPPQQPPYGGPHPQPYPKPGEAPFQGPYAHQPLVIVQPTVCVSSGPLQQPLPDYLAYSIFTMLCCCLPLGVGALIYSINTREANRTGSRETAERSSRLAHKLNNSALIVGLVFIVVYIIIIAK